MSSDSISVIIPTYNRAHLVSRAITSALSQLIDGDELIVVDDGSTDATREVVAEFGDRLRYVRTENGGAGAARNTGLTEASNPLIAFLDSDDEWLPGRIPLQRMLLEARPDLGFCFSNFGYRSPDEVVEFALGKMWTHDGRSYEEILGGSCMYSSVAPLPEGVSDFHIYEGNLYFELLSAIHVNVNTLLLRSELVRPDVRFAEDTSTWEDWEFTSRLARENHCAYLDCELSVQIAHSGSRLTDTDWYEVAEARIPMLERVWGRDADFLAKHGEDYRRVLDEQHLALGHRALVAGRSREARMHFGQVKSAPLTYRVVAALPGPAARAMMKLRELIR